MPRLHTENETKSAGVAGLQAGIRSSARSYLIDRIGRYGVQPNVLFERLAEEEDISARRALLLHSPISGHFAHRIKNSARSFRSFSRC